ncbi:hypothetical protein OC846_000234 [Tilletia horrida]|uniref:Uncharacterized protein n=1 Tax=Tilletia horrida TaxID=155126 RepID=A0AAN6GVX1_9BASI|nr:hypothetical protein OC846_000234 [Tilletia horrida]KAK0570359.1 hypothetical protein OC861_000102 [Tilletia horrida]
MVRTALQRPLAAAATTTSTATGTAASAATAAHYQHQDHYGQHHHQNSWRGRGFIPVASQSQSPPQPQPNHQYSWPGTGSRLHSSIGEPAGKPPQDGEVHDAPKDDDECFYDALSSVSPPPVLVPATQEESRLEENLKPPRPPITPPPLAPKQIPATIAPSASSYHAQFGSLPSRTTTTNPVPPSSPPQNFSQPSSPPQQQQQQQQHRSHRRSVSSSSILSFGSLGPPTELLQAIYRILPSPLAAQERRHQQLQLQLALLQQHEQDQQDLQQQQQQQQQQQNASPQQHQQQPQTVLAAPIFLQNNATSYPPTSTSTAAVPTILLPSSVDVFGGIVDAHALEAYSNTLRERGWVEDLSEDEDAEDKQAHTPIEGGAITPALTSSVRPPQEDDDIIASPFRPPAQSLRQYYPSVYHQQELERRQQMSRDSVRMEQEKRKAAAAIAQAQHEAQAVGSRILDHADVGENRQARLDANHIPPPPAYEHNSQQHGSQPQQPFASLDRPQAEPGQALEASGSGEGGAAAATGANEDDEHDSERRFMRAKREEWEQALAREREREKERTLRRHNTLHAGAGGAAGYLSNRRRTMPPLHQILQPPGAVPPSNSFAGAAVVPQQATTQVQQQRRRELPPAIAAAINAPRTPLRAGVLPTATIHDGAGGGGANDTAVATAGAGAGTGNVNGNSSSLHRSASRSHIIDAWRSTVQVPPTRGRISGGTSSQRQQQQIQAHHRGRSESYGMVGGGMTTGPIGNPIGLGIGTVQHQVAGLGRMESRV